MLPLLPVETQVDLGEAEAAEMVHLTDLQMQEPEPQTPAAEAVEAAVDLRQR